MTGASSGLGRGMAREFAGRGHDLALCARRTEQLAELQAELHAAHPRVKVSVHALDVLDHEQVFAVFRAFRDEFGTLYRVIANAGLGKGKPLGTGYFRANRETAETNFVEKVKSTPFMIDTETGCRLLAREIDAEPQSACVPRWPWTPLGVAVRHLPLLVVAKMG
ncbi:MAG: SDR family NAD(P)-dependent oxidoreductase [Solimonas sp.]